MRHYHTLKPSNKILSRFSCYKFLPEILQIDIKMKQLVLVVLIACVVGVHSQTPCFKCLLCPRPNCGPNFTLESFGTLLGCCCYTCVPNAGKYYFIYLIYTLFIAFVLKVKTRGVDERLFYPLTLIVIRG